MSQDAALFLGISTRHFLLASFCVRLDFVANAVDDGHCHFGTFHGQIYCIVGVVTVVIVFHFQRSGASGLLEQSAFELRSNLRLHSSNG